MNNMTRLPRAEKRETALARFLVRTRKENTLTIRQAAAIAGVPASVFGSWEKGASPSLDSVPGLKRFCDHFKVSLSFALTGERDAASGGGGIDDHFHKSDLFSGFAEITIRRLVPKSEMDKKKPS